MGQAPPDEGVRSLLEVGAPAEAGRPAAPRAVSALALGHGADLWAKANAYYFRTMSRLQRLWQVGGPPDAHAAPPASCRLHWAPAVRRAADATERPKLLVGQAAASSTQRDDAVRRAWLHA
jgi:hypothetical protein